VPADYEFPVVPVTRLLDEAAASFPDAPAVVFLGSTLSYRRLKADVDRFAGALAALGVSKGDRVAIVLPNCPQNVVAFFAVLRLGGVAVQHNPLYTEAELRHQLADSGATVVVCLDRTYPLVRSVQADTAVRRVVVASLTDYLPVRQRLTLRLPMRAARTKRAQLVAPLPAGERPEQFGALLRSGAAPAAQESVDPLTDLAVLQYTGGTTGRPRGAMLTHHNLVANAYQVRLWLPEAVAGRETTLAVLPLFHCYGLTLCLTATVLLAGKLVLLPRFDLDLLFQAVDAHRPTLLPGVPPIYRALIDSPQLRRHDLQSIRACISGAMKLPHDTQEQFERITGGRLVEGYGLTEASPATHANPVHGKRKSGTVGLPLPGTWCRLVDPENPRRDVPLGEPGELAIKGPQVFRGYWGQEDLAGIFTDDGYLLTGDIATMDSEGFFTIVDRRKELIISGGFNVYPSEVEDVLQGVGGVVEAAVIGVPDRYRGETVKAFVVQSRDSTLTEDDIRRACAEQLTSYKVPKLVEFRDSLPHTAVGKPMRRLLQDEELARLAAETPSPAPAKSAAAKRAPAKRVPTKRNGSATPRKTTSR
jgi:long-chain acyl-CoA synthetase